MALQREIEAVLDNYPRIYFACHLRHVRDEATGQKLSAHQASLLDHLDPVDGTSVLELARHMAVSPPTMSLALDRLAQRGYLRRAKDERDGRRVLVFLTPAGEAIKRQRKVLEPELVGALLDRLDKQQRQQALAGLRLLGQAAAALIDSPRFRELVRS